MMPLLWVAIGGAAGSILRYGIQQPVKMFLFPFGTLVVNMGGCFFIGLLWAYAAKGQLTESARLQLVTGFCGGFTTFSAFSQEGLAMLQQSKFAHFFIYTVVSVAAGLLATFAGYKLIT